MSPAGLSPLRGEMTGWTLKPNGVAAGVEFRMSNPHLRTSQCHVNNRSFRTKQSQTATRYTARAERAFCQISDVDALVHTLGLLASSPDSLGLVLSGARMTIPGARESGIIPPTSCQLTKCHPNVITVTPHGML